MDTKRQLIVIIDDEESVRRALKRLLISAGFGAHSYPTGDEFIQSLSTTRPDCVVLDLHMPGMNGFDIQEHLQNEPNPIPVIVITGQDTDEAQKRALGAGAVAYLRKPVDDQTLLRAISNAIPACQEQSE